MSERPAPTAINQRRTDGLTVVPCQNPKISSGFVPARKVTKPPFGMAYISASNTSWLINEMMVVPARAGTDARAGARADSPARR